MPINDATKLALAQDLGEIVFFLRNSQDRMRVKVKTLDGLFATYEDKTANTYEYYSSHARKKLSFVSGKNDDIKTHANVVVNSPALTFDKNSSPPQIETGQEIDKKADKIEQVIKENTPN